MKYPYKKQLCSCVATLFRSAARFARVGILNSRPDGSRVVLVSVAEFFVCFIFYFVGNLPVGIFLMGIFLVTVATRVEQRLYISLFYSLILYKLNLYKREDRVYILTIALENQSSFARSHRCVRSTSLSGLRFHGVCCTKCGLSRRVLPTISSCLYIGKFTQIFEATVI